ncbi:hypothetical protein BS50DRAFT_242353 [Corynespora cassiicola Philippines]|uniref:Uncharacterized protein n=1 Tax=Corynespora cassiicola Philippines TaxID=1448308 RepID=A0A2T2P321_CORCC|nr:hypothetical protein BS50DRAFT_242353 [Corynespora cassiicola Philippines]
MDKAPRPYCLGMYSPFSYILSKCYNSLRLILFSRLKTVYLHVYVDIYLPRYTTTQQSSRQTPAADLTGQALECTTHQSSTKTSRHPLFRSELSLPITSPPFCPSGSPPPVAPATYKKKESDVKKRKALGVGRFHVGHAHTIPNRAGQPHVLHTAPEP